MKNKIYLSIILVPITLLSFRKFVFQKGNAPIHLACFHGYADIVELLLDAGCDINLPSKVIYLFHV